MSTDTRAQIAQDRRPLANCLGRSAEPGDRGAVWVKRMFMTNSGLCIDDMKTPCSYADLLAKSLADAQAL